MSPLLQQPALPPSNIYLLLRPETMSRNVLHFTPHRSFPSQRPLQENSQSGDMYTARDAHTFHQEGITIPLLERISSPSSLAHTPSPQSSMSGFEGAVIRYESNSPSPTPSQIDTDLARFPPSPADSEVVHYQVMEATTPPPDQINGTITLCKAILRYRQVHPKLSEFMEACTGDLMISITAMSNADATRPLPITNGEYNHIAHLTYVSAFTDKIEPYLEDAIQEIGPPPTLLQRISTPSHISVIDSEEETDHPGQGWIEYDTTNPKHYPLIFINEANEEEVAKYI